MIRSYKISFPTNTVLLIRHSPSCSGIYSFN
nr:MAG TPA: hypothetical protein [Caudoviricetes sp.]